MVDRGQGDIRRPAAALAISGTGDWAATIALSLVVYAKTGSAVWLSMTFLLTRLPSALVAPVSAVALAVTLRWTPWRRAEPGPAPRTAGP
jgi:hypothetical protein